MLPPFTMTNDSSQFYILVLYSFVLFREAVISTIMNNDASYLYLPELKILAKFTESDNNLSKSIDGAVGK